MWAEAAKSLSKFDQAVLTMLDVDGYPLSVRVDTRAYDPATGELPASLPNELRAVEGPANLLCHYHDEKLWNIQAVGIKGHIAERDGTWVFQSTSFNAPSKLAILSFVKNARSSAQKYLDRRGLKRPEVNWDAINEIKRRVSEKR